MRWKDSLLCGSSLVIVAFGQSFLIPYLGMFAAAFGLTLFWIGIAHRKDRFWLSVFWFSLVQAIQLSWFTSIEYMGPYILVVYGCLIFLIGLQFGCLSFFLKKGREISLSDCFALGGLWVILEWLRTFFFTGFTWNPIGLALADSSYAIQFAALFGVYGLSFWVIFVNAFGLYALHSWKKGSVWAFLVFLPYLYGFGQQEWVKRNVSEEGTVLVSLVQTGILPEQKDLFFDRQESYIPPLNQWERIFEQIEKTAGSDLIVLPEAAISRGASRYVYPIEMVKSLWIYYFGEDSIGDFPSLEAPFARMVEYQGERLWKVTNGFIVQALANHFNAKVIVGFDDQDGDSHYNAAFYFKPQGFSGERYEKRVLVPVAEYIPFSGFSFVSEFLSDQFGIGDSMQTGTEAKIFSSFCPIGVSVCLEETYSHLIRDLRLKGARLFVNVTNDVWFPHTCLPERHFLHGKIRSAENGVYSLRACNTGVTGVIDCLGGAVKVLSSSDENVDILKVSIPLRSFHTIYTWWGNWAILCWSFFFLLFRWRYSILEIYRSMRWSIFFQKKCKKL